MLPSRWPSDWTTDVFLLLLQCGLLRAPADREAVLKPQMGLYAVHEGAPVLILECFTWRGNANGATHTIDKRSLRTCAAACQRWLEFSLSGESAWLPLLSRDYFYRSAALGSFRCSAADPTTLPTRGEASQSISFRRPSYYNPRMPRGMRKLIVTVLACSLTTSSRWFGIFQCQWKWTPEIIDAGPVQTKDAKLTVMRLSFPWRPLTFLGPCPKHMQSPRILGEVQQTWSFFFPLFFVLQLREQGEVSRDGPRSAEVSRPRPTYPS